MGTIFQGEEEEEEEEGREGGFFSKREANLKNWGKRRKEVL